MSIWGSFSDGQPLSFSLPPVRVGILCEFNYSKYSIIRVGEIFVMHQCCIFFRQVGTNLVIYVNIVELASGCYSK